jgi:hypothetical protein
VLLASAGCIAKATHCTAQHHKSIQCATTGELAHAASHSTGSLPTTASATALRTAALQLQRSHSVMQRPPTSSSTHQNKRSTNLTCKLEAEAACAETCWCTPTQLRVQLTYTWLILQHHASRVLLMAEMRACDKHCAVVDQLVPPKRTSASHAL